MSKKNLNYLSTPVNTKKTQKVKTRGVPYPPVIENYLYVKIDGNLDSKEEPQGEGRYDWRGTSYYSNNFIGIYKSYKGITETIDFPANVGDTVYVVWAEYSTGDSFGYSDCGSTCVVGIWKTKDLADAAYRSCNSKKHDLAPVLFYESGASIKFKPPWVGYFEQLEKLHITEAVIQD